MQIVIDEGGEVIVDGRRRVVQRREQVLADIPDLGGVPFEAVKYKADMFPVKLQKP